MPYKNIEDRRACNARWKKNNPEKANAWETSQSKLYKRGRHLKKTYGITLDEFDAMLEEQGGVCAICGTDTCPSKREYLSVDHDHGTGRVRGLICHHCNLILGYAKDDIERLKKAIAYLEGGDADALQTP